MSRGWKWFLVLFLLFFVDAVLCIVWGVTKGVWFYFVVPMVVWSLLCLVFGLFWVYEVWDFGVKSRSELSTCEAEGLVQDFVLKLDCPVRLFFDDRSVSLVREVAENGFVVYVLRNAYSLRVGGLRDFWTFFIPEVNPKDINFLCNPSDNEVYQRLRKLAGERDRERVIIEEDAYGSRKIFEKPRNKDVSDGLLPGKEEVGG